MSSPRFHLRCRDALAALCLALLVACGGGAGEMGSGGTGATAEGTITGFGSIFVDGARFDDSAAEISSDAPDGTVAAAETKLGQRVTVAFAAEGVAQTVKVEPEVVGVVSSLTAGGFKVLGQTVLVNIDPAAGPVTQFEGYTSVVDVKVADLVEVHGVASGAPGSGVIQATRVEKRASLGFLRVAGVVTALSVNGAGTTFTLGTLTVDASNAVIVPPTRPLQAGQTVVVFAANTALGGNTLTASRVRIRERSNGSLPDYLGGVISNLAGDGSSFTLGSVTVTRSAGTRLEPANATLANGRYVQVRGAFTADGSLAASEIKARSGGGLLDADLRGTAIGYDAVARTFSVRGVTVRMGAVVPTGCPADLSNQYVEVTGRIALGGVDASSIRCESSPPSDAVIERRGTAGSVVAAARTFVLTDGATQTSVRWTPLTFFRDGLERTAASLNGKALRVEGVLVNGVLVATKVRLDS